MSEFTYEFTLTLTTSEELDFYDREHICRQLREATRFQPGSVSSRLVRSLTGRPAEEGS